MSTETLAPPNPSGTKAQPKSRASDPTKALAMIQTRWKLLEPRLEVYRMVEAAYDRVPPDSEADLRMDGLAWTANVDWGGMEGGVNDKASTLWNLATQPDTYVQFECNDTGRAKVVQYEKILAEKDKELLDDWSEWHTELEIMAHNCAAHGLGIFHFAHPRGWHFRSLHPGNLITPNVKAKLNPNSWPWYAIKTEFEITDLLKKLENKKEAGVVGWNTSAIAKLIAKCANAGGSTWASAIYKDVETYALDLKSNDIFFANENKITIPGFIFYVQEWDGKVSEHFLPEEDGIGFIYSGIGRHKQMSDTLALFPLSLSQGYIERVRGYGIKMLPYHDMENRVMNHAIDVTWTASNMIIQGESGDDIQKLRELQIHGPFTLLPDDLKLQTQSFQNPAAGLLSLQREFGNMSAVRSRSMGGPDVSASRNVEKSATQSRIEWQQSQGANTNEVSRFYLQLQHFHRIRTARIADPKLTDKDPGGKEALAMLKECEALGVTKEDIASIKRTKVRTIFGDGDPTNQFLALMDLKEFYGTMTEDGKADFRFEVFHSRLRNRDLARRFAGDKNNDATFATHVWNAQNENNIFETSDTKINVRPDDLHLVHAGEHTVYAEEVYLRLEQGQISTQDAFTKVARTDSHNQEHLVRLGGDKFSAEAWKDLNRRWADLRNKQNHLRQQIEAQAMEKQAADMEEMRNPRLSVADQEAIKSAEAKRQIELDAASTRKQIELDKAQLEMQLTKDKHLRKTQAEIAKQTQQIPQEGNPYGALGKQ